jgi:phospholipid/cholesterol/gamma-HCH transport system substrate-binding protein
MKRMNDLIVGGVVLASVVIIIAATLWVNESEFGDRQDPVVAKLRDVGNVRVGNAVVIRGVHAGRVEAIELADGGWVRMRLRLEPQVQLPKDPVVLLTAASLFGEWQATITTRAGLPDNPDIRRQITEATGDRNAIPGAMVPDIAQLTAVAGGIAGNVASVAERFKVAFTDDAARELRTTIANFGDLSADLARTVRRQSRNIDDIAVDVRGGVRELQTTAESFRRVAQRFDSATAAGEVRALVESLAKAATQLETATAQLDRLTGRLDLTQQRLDRVLARSDSVLDKINAGQGSLGLLVNDSRLYHRSDSLVTQLRALAADIQANPKRYVRITLF